MKKWFLLTMVMVFCCSANAGEFFSLNDWRAYKDVMTPLNKKGCFAETSTEIDHNGVVEKWNLQVIRLAAGNGEYTYPIIIAFPENQLAETYYEAQGQSNKEGTSLFNMTLLQPESGKTSIVAARTKDRNALISRLKGDKTFKVSYLNKDSIVRDITFSLSGSSKTIKELRKECL